ncbi:MAG TPA: response regulator [Thermoanaerobaculia bacterium]|jgi:CheY-like chemotaxis protein|nr:response regulator [Thermoanaerobaculia bacterium]
MMTEQHRRVLVVDDEASVRDVLVTALRRKSLIIDQASDGSEAIDLLQQHTYSVVLLDMMMPGIDGYGVLDAIDHTLANAPIVLVVSGAARAVLQDLDSRKIHGIIRKPFDPHEIATVVHSCAELRGRSALETMALATMMTGAPLIALLKL